MRPEGDGGIFSWGLKVNADKSKMMVWSLECEVIVDGVQLDYVSEFKNLGWILVESATGGAVL